MVKLTDIAGIAKEEEESKMFRRDDLTKVNKEWALASLSLQTDTWPLDHPTTASASFLAVTGLI